MPNLATIYVFGAKRRVNSHRVLKIGRAGGGVDGLNKRQRQHENDLKKLRLPYEMELLAAIISPNAGSDETALKNAFPNTLASDGGASYYARGYVSKRNGAAPEFYFEPSQKMVDWVRAIGKLGFVATSYEQLDDFYNRRIICPDYKEWCPEGVEAPAYPRQSALDFLANADDADLWHDARPVDSMDSEGDYYTPDKIVDMARIVMGGIDLDPASCKLANWGDAQHSGVRAARYFTAIENGLDQQWSGRVWLNPPFSQWREWLSHLIGEMDAGRVTQACVLAPINAVTGLAFFDTGFVRRADRLLITEGRPNYWGPKAGSPTSGYAIYYFGPNGDKFDVEFGRFGVVYERPRNAIFGQQGCAHDPTEKRKLKEMLE